MEEFKRFFFVCKCTDISHTLAFGFWPDENDEKAVFVELMLNPSVGIIRRIGIALGYVFFPRKCRFGSFQETVLGPEHVNDLKKIVEYLEK